MTTRQLDAYYESVYTILSDRRDHFGSTLDSFYSMLQARLDLFESAQRQIAVYNAPDFTSFKYIRLDENMISEIIADLLNANGVHGQGNLFIRLFCDTFGIEFSRLGASYRVQTQVPLSSGSDLGFIDILIDSNAFGVGVENKPWAADQPAQVERYCKALDMRYRGNFCLLYLTPTGGDPTSVSHQMREDLKIMSKLKLISYNEIRRWCLDSARACEADRVRWFLRDLSQCLAAKFEEAITPDES